MKMSDFFHRKIKTFSRVIGIDDLQEQVTESRILASRVLINQLKAAGELPRIADAEFKVFSQFGDDGIIQYLIHKIDIPREKQIFIEFGVQDYQESNTRFLLRNDNWRGLILDGDPSNIEYVIHSAEYWRHDLTAVAAFIDCDNVNDLFKQSGFSGEIGLLSIDIDGNDYWVWERIDSVNPIIVVAEYNSTFGAQLAVTVPYDAGFQRGLAHYSNLYWGASLQALSRLASRKGYVFVGCNGAGNNAYFVRADKLGSLKPISVEEGYVEARFRESRNRAGELSYLSGDAKLREIRDMPLYDLVANELRSVDELYFSNCLNCI